MKVVSELGILYGLATDIHGVLTREGRPLRPSEIRPLLKKPVHFPTEKQFWLTAARVIRDVGTSPGGRWRRVGYGLYAANDMTHPWLREGILIRQKQTGAICAVKGHYVIGKLLRFQRWYIGKPGIKFRWAINTCDLEKYWEPVKTAA